MISKPSPVQEQLLTLADDKMVKQMTKQSTLFPEKQTPILNNLKLSEAQGIAHQVKSTVASHCERIEVAGSIRRQKPKVHDIDFVVVTRSDAEWLKINEELKRLKAKPSCQGSAVIRALLPCQNGLFQVDFYRAQTSTYGINLLIRTGSADHNMWLAGFAMSKGLRIRYSQGLFKDGSVISGSEERGVFEALELPFPSPSDREVADGKPIWQLQVERNYY